MNSPILAILVMIIIIIGSTPTLMNEALSIMNKASKGGPQAWCGPITLQRHYSTGCLITTADLR